MYYDQELVMIRNHGNAFYHHEQNMTTQVFELATYDSYLKFINDANSTLLYKTSNWTIGQDMVAPIYIDAKSSKLIFVGKRPTLKIFGLPVYFENFNREVLSMNVNPLNQQLNAVSKC